MACFDPYDFWATSFGVAVRQGYYSGRVTGKIAAASLSVFDWWAPELGRRIIGAKPRNYPIVIAHEVLRLMVMEKLSEPEASVLFQSICSLSVDSSSHSISWGLGFPWMCKNGLYGPNIPFVTHTPYVMEALLSLAKYPGLQIEAMTLFQDTWGFLKSLRIMHEGSNGIALSYAPVAESRIVVNANAYAAFAYGLHAVHGQNVIKEVARDRAIHLVEWITHQQQTNGAWFYYADQEPKNFIDCFHSCFVLKNLLKVNRLIPEVSKITLPSIERGWSFIRSNFYEEKHKLCRRFVKRAQWDPFLWDLYDQAEYLGLLVDFGLIEEAREFSLWVEGVFSKGEDWYCRSDVLGRLWGKNFLRWGITPFWYHKARLNNIINGTS